AIARRSPPDVRIAFGLAELTGRLLGERNFAQAELRAQDCLTIYEKIKPNDPKAFQARGLLGAALLRQKKYTDAEREYRRMANDLRKTADSGGVAASLWNLAGVLAAQGKLGEGRKDVSRSAQPPPSTVQQCAATGDSYAGTRTP